MKLKMKKRKRSAKINVPVRINDTVPIYKDLYDIHTHVDIKSEYLKT